MDKRFFLALALSAMVIVLVQFIFPQPKRVPGADSARVAATAAAAGDTTHRGAVVGASGAAGGAAVGGVVAPGTPLDSAAAAAAAVAPRVTTVRTDTTAIYRFNNVGAAPVSAELL